MQHLFKISSNGQGCELSFFVVKYTCYRTYSGDREEVYYASSVEFHNFRYGRRSLLLHLQMAGRTFVVINLKA